MALNGTMELIETVTVPSGGQAAIEFLNIPQNYTDLKVVISTRNNSNNYGGFYMRFNGSSSSYSARRLFQDAGTAGSNTSTEITWVFSNWTGNTFSNSEIFIPNYTSSSNKSASIDSVAENNGVDCRNILTAFLWSNTAPITSIAFSTFDTGAPNDFFVQHSTATLYGISKIPSNVKATGGDITHDASYFYHTFTSSGTFTPLENLTVDYLVVAGGGSGGGYVGGGGGAGGLRSTVTATGGGGSLESPLSLTESTNYTVTIGAGAAGGAGFTDQNNGSDSTFATITSIGGGSGRRGGGAGISGGSIGGSGGGGGSASGAETGYAGTANQGYAGGNSAGPSGNYGSGGGGGAGAAGGAGGGSGGNGGAGVATSISGSSVTYAGGGGGAEGSGGTPGTGGAGGGGNGANGNGDGSVAVSSTAGTANTGGGGGGGGLTSNNVYCQQGGSGIVIVRYAK